MAQSTCVCSTATPLSPRMMSTPSNSVTGVFRVLVRVSIVILKTNLSWWTRTMRPSAILILWKREGPRDSLASHEKSVLTRDQLAHMSKRSNSVRGVGGKGNSSIFYCYDLSQMEGIRGRAFYHGYFVHIAWLIFRCARLIVLEKM